MTNKIERQREKPTLTDRLRYIFRVPIEKTGEFLYKLGVEPNHMTIAGVIGTAVGAYFVGRGQLTLGGIIILAMGPIDFLDGAVARAKGAPEAYGAFLDSVSDRYIELMIFGALLWYYVTGDEMGNAVLTFLAASGSVLVSYVRSRAQSLGYDAKVGILTRVERFIVVAPTIIFRVPHIGVIITAVLANFTALQRIYHVRKQANRKPGSKDD